jgi:arylformamidase
MPRVIDLSLTYHPGMPGVALEDTKLLTRDGWNAKTLHLYGHAGTHMDAPVHFGVGTQTIDQLPLESCMGPAWILDIAPAMPKLSIGVAHLGELQHQIQPGDSLLVKTGWSRFAGEPRYRDELPRISLELAQWCVERKIRMLGVEPPSVADVNNLPEVTLIHQTLFRGGVIIVEGLCNLEAISHRKVTFIAIPLKIAAGDGSPVRALAIENDER